MKTNHAVVPDHLVPATSPAEGRPTFDEMADQVYRLAEGIRLGLQLEDLEMANVCRYVRRVLIKLDSKRCFQATQQFHSAVAHLLAQYVLTGDEWTRLWSDLVEFYEGGHVDVVPGAPKRLNEKGGAA